MRYLYLAGLIGLVVVTGANTAAASCVGTPPTGLDPTGVSDNTVAIQTAIDTANANGGGAVVLPPGRYLTTGALVVKRGVVLCGSTHGPFDIGAVDPAVTTIAATLLITNTTTPFLTLQDTGAAVTDLIFHYPNQVPPTTSSPNVYPTTIRVTGPGTKIERSTVTNAWEFLDIQIGRVTARDLYIGAYYCGIRIDHAQDRVTINNIIFSVFWDNGAYASYPQNIDGWAIDNSYAFMIFRMDSLQVSDVLIFNRYAGFYLADSPDESLSPRMGYGSFTNIDIDTCSNGILAMSSNIPGYKFTNLDIGCHNTHFGPGDYGILQLAGGTTPPLVLVNGGSIRGTWNGAKFGTFTPPARLVVAHIFEHE